MMSKKYLILLCFTFVSALIAQENSFQSGEFLKFRVKYGFFNTSYAQLILKQTQINGNTFFHAIGKGETVGLARLFFKVDDTYESFFLTQKVRPIIFIRDIYEGGYTKNIRVNFNHNHQNATIYNLEEKSSTIVSTPKSIQDAISAFYFLREQTDVSKIKEGDEISIETLFDDDEIFTFKLKLIRKEPIETRFGTIETLVFQPQVQNGRVFRNKESVTLWISNDKNKIPIKIRAELRVGSLVAELIDFNMLKYPTTLKK